MRLPCPRTRASASPAMLLYGKNPNNAFLQCIKVLMFDAVALLGEVYGWEEAVWHKVCIPIDG